MVLRHRLVLLLHLLLRLRELGVVLRLRVRVGVRARLRVGICCRACMSWAYCACCA